MCATIRRTTGATTKRAAKAIGQLVNQADIQAAPNPSTSPVARAVYIPDTIMDIKPLVSRLKRTGA